MDEIYSGLRAWAEVDFDAIRHNHGALKALVGDGVKVAAVIKADAYGHGARRIAGLLRNRVDYFAVAMTDEAEELRRDGITNPILVLAHTPEGDLPRLARYGIETSVSNLEEALEISRYAGPRGLTVGVHVALDTGMCRIGFDCSEESARQIEEISRLPGVEIKGVFSHFAAADSSDLSYTKKQAQAFEFVLASLEARGVKIKLRHLCNSAGAVAFDKKYDMVREGIVLYGIAPSGEVELSALGELKPAMSLRTHISGLRRVPAGTPVSYGCTYVTERDSVIATLQAGYADGVPRLLSNCGDVLVRGKRARIAGRVCMDQMMADVTDISGVKVGDVVTIFGRDGEEEISACEVASHAQTIPYEIVCGISKRVPRVYTENGHVAGISRMLRD